MFGFPFFVNFLAKVEHVDDKSLSSKNAHVQFLKLKLILIIPMLGISVFLLFVITRIFYL